MDLKLYNSLTREKEIFQPLDSKNVRLYACGPTVYSYAHIGNARMAVVFDVLSRVLKSLYPKVIYVSNITDVDDKIMIAAKETGVSISEITTKYERIYNEDMAALGVAKPDVQPRATEHIGEMIALIEQLIAKNHAYAAEGHVLFNVPSYSAYGALSGRSRDDQIAGARVEIAPYKRDPADFVLWKPSAHDEPGWESPWGYGRPGWHIECSAMAEKHLGLPFDIHGGGADLKFPHHENEIAQSCCAHGETNQPAGFAKLWAHNGFVTVEGEKMSKSLGNVTLVHGLIEQGVSGQIIRLALLSAHYRQPLDWTREALRQAELLKEKIDKAADRLKEIKPIKTENKNPVLTALLDDLNTPLAFSRLGVLAGNILKEEPSSLSVLKTHFEEGLAVLGIIPEAIKTVQEDIPPDIQTLVEARQAARQSKDFKRADELRDQLAKNGYVIEDTAKGITIRRT